VAQVAKCGKANQRGSHSWRENFRGTWENRQSCS